MNGSEIIDKKAIDCYERTDLYFNSKGDTEFKRCFLNGFYEGYKIAKSDLYNCFCKQCEHYDKENVCKKYTAYTPFNRENDCEIIKGIFNSEI